MSITSMTGFARVNGQVALNGQDVGWVWEIKSVNGKGLDIKSRLPWGYEELGMELKNLAQPYLARGSVNASLEINFATANKKALIDEKLLEDLTQRAVLLVESNKGKVSAPSAAELLGLKGVVELQDDGLSEEARNILCQKILADFVVLCQNLHSERMREGEKIKSALIQILDKIAGNVGKIEACAEGLPQMLQAKLKGQLRQLNSEIEFSEERVAQEVVLLVTRADIREEIDRLKAHIKSAFEMLDEKGAMGRRLDFLCQELNREANTTCSKSTTIEITNLGMELKALIEQFREQVQNIE